VAGSAPRETEHLVSDLKSIDAIADGGYHSGEIATLA
jgi:hypothetical protein